MDRLCGNVDQDKVFSYDTRQVVRIKDRYLGCTLNVLYFGIMLYIALGVFWWGEGYLSYDQARGGIATHVKGDTVATGTGPGGVRYYSAEDITYPGLENGRIFVATRETVTKQKRGICDDKDMPCEKDSDCTVALGGTCSEHGFCHEAGWCPIEGEEPTYYDLNTGEMQIWIKSFVHFALLDRENQKDPMSAEFTSMTTGNQGMKRPFIFSTITKNHSRPERGYNLFSVNELLAMCKPVPVRFEEIAELGTTIEVVFSFACDVRYQTCKPEMKVRRLDLLFHPERIGFSFDRADYVSDDERVRHHMRGVRIFIQTVGRGSMVDLNALVMKFATTTSLLCVAPIIADLLMLHCFQYAKRYRARKYDISPPMEPYLKDLDERMKSNRKIIGQTRDEQKWSAEQEEFNKRMREEDE